MLWRNDFNQGSPRPKLLGGGGGQGVWTSHLKYLWLSLLLPFLQWFYSLCPKMFLKFSRFPQPKDFSLPCTFPFPTSFQGLPPSCPHQPRWFENHRLRLGIISLSFDIQTFRLEEFQHLSFFIFFLCPKHVTKKWIINFLSSLKIFQPSFFIIMFFNMINLTIMDWIWYLISFWLSSMCQRSTGLETW